MPAKSRLNVFLRGYLLLFERREAPSYSPKTGIALLIAFFFMEYLVGPRASILQWFGVAQPPSWARIIVLSAIAMLATLLARAKLSDVGLLPFSRWTAGETIYVGQAFLVGAAIFMFINLATLRAQPGAAMQLVAISAATEIIWGFYQELIYRGLLQTELARRFGAIAGIVVANVLFVFGPLHFYEFSGSSAPLSKAIFFSATFAIGLIFGYIALRTRNVMFVGILHGVGDAVANVPQFLHGAR
jgi:membrane protease YdiL (CAAX protease family)